MGEVNKFVIVVILCMVFITFASSLLSVANQNNGGVYPNSDYPSFKTVNANVAYYDNQTRTLQAQMSNVGKTNTQGWDVGTFVLFITYGANLAIISMFGFMTTGVSLMFDAVNTIGVPPFFAILAMVYIIYKFAAGVAGAIRGAPL